ncbi:hypothetical protein [Campylobacter phage CJLB-12]|nr:hypothetical protein [Campylobacter phage CJLB-12]QXO06529.1 hypothetical protein [Campylobacter phage CJLB-14]
MSLTILNFKTNNTIKTQLTYNQLEVLKKSFNAF